MESDGHQGPPAPAGGEAAARARRAGALLWPAAALALAAGWGWGLLLSPADYRQGETVRILYVHVPAAWASLLCWAAMAGLGAGLLATRREWLGIALEAAAWSGFWATALALATGSLWGRPVWGLWWAWDARLTAELVLLFMYCAALALPSAFAERSQGRRAAAVLALVGLAHLPIVKFSVAWWISLHQGSSVIAPAERRLPPEFLHPLLLSAAGVLLLAAATACARLEAGLLREGRRG